MAADPLAVAKEAVEQMFSELTEYDECKNALEELASDIDGMLVALEEEENREDGE